MHVIRLRGPWEACEPTEGRCFQRRFHRPSGLASDQSVHLRLTPPVGTSCRIQLNGEAMEIAEQPDGSQSCAIEAHLSNYNLLRLEVAGDATPADLQVQLVIDE